MVIVFRATQLEQIIHNGVAAFTFGIFLPIRFIFERLIDEAARRSVEVETQRFGNIPAEVVVAVPGKTPVVVGVQFGILSGKTIGSCTDQTLQIGIESVGIWQRIKIEF